MSGDSNMNRRGDYQVNDDESLRRPSSKIDIRVNELKKSEERQNYDWFTFTVFLLIGTTSLMGWNSFMNMLSSILRIVFNGQGSFTDTMTATYFTVLCIVTLTFAKVNVAKPWVLLLGLVSMAILCVVLALICTLVPASAASPVLHVFGVAMALAAGTIVSAGFGLAASLPKLQVGAVASGMGFAGLLSFTMWMLARHLIFNQDISGVKSAIWTLLGFAAFICVIAIVSFVAFLKTRWVVEFFEEQRLISKKDEEQLGDSELKDDPKCYERLGSFGIIWEISGNVTLRFLIFFQTMVVFPNIGPVGWNDSPVIADIAIGTFQLLDFLGRYLPNVVPVLLFPESLLKWGIIARLFIVISFIVSMKFPNLVVFGAGWFHILSMALLAFTSGWFSTVAAVHLPGHVNGPTAKSRASTFGIAVGIIGVVVGQWTSKLLKVILK